MATTIATAISTFSGTQPADGSPRNNGLSHRAIFICLQYLDVVAVIYIQSGFSC